MVSLTVKESHSADENSIVDINKDKKKEGSKLNTTEIKMNIIAENINTRICLPLLWHLERK